MQNGRRTRATSEKAVRNVANDALEGYLQQAGERAKVRQGGVVGRGRFVDEVHDLVAVSTVVESRDP